MTLPAATDPAPPFPQGLDDKIQGISSFRTANDDFYRIDTRLSLPTLGVEDYELVIDGDVEKELSFSFEDLTKMDLIERDITLTCVSNDVGGPYVGAPAGSASGSPTCSTWPASAAPPTRSCRPTSTA